MIGRTAWIGAMLRLKPARFPWGHSIRSGLSVGLPLIVGAATGHVVIGMWIGLASLLLAAGEREGSHRLNITNLAISTPIAASAYLLGYLQSWPVWGIIPLMMVLGWFAGIIAGYGPGFSVGGMQFLLVAAIAVGVTSYHTWWQPIVWYAVGAVFYLALMVIEFAVDRRRPERIAMGSLIDALDALAQVKMEQPEPADLAAARARVVTAIIAARGVLETSAGARPSAHWADFTAAVDTGESLLALLLAEDSTDTLQFVGAELKALHQGTSRHEPTTGYTTQQVRIFAARVGDLSVGLGVAGGPQLPPTTTDQKTIRPWLERLAVGREVRGAASRLALCCAIAYGAKIYLPIEHWFWVPLTIALVMKPDFGSVFGRAVLRVVGTVIGAALAAAVIWWVHPLVGIAILIGVFSFFVPWFMMRSYALQAVAIAPVVILLVYSLNPSPGEDLPEQRILATAVGGVVVIVFGYLIWPAARRVDIPRVLRGAVGSLGDFAAQAVTPIPEDASKQRLRHDAVVDARRQTYAALSDLRTHLQRGLTEPPPADEQAAEWIPAVVALEQLTDAVSNYSVQRLEGQPVADAAAWVSLIKALPTYTSPADLTSQATVTAQILGR